MASYFKENIERITEQMIEEEILTDTENIRTDAIKQIEGIKNGSLDYIDKEEQSALEFIEDEKQSALDYIADEKSDLLQEFSEDSGIIKELNDIDASANTIYEKTVAVANNTITKIEGNIRNLIVDNGYGITFSDDSNGNVTMTVGKVD